MVTGVDAFHIDFAVIDFFGQSSVQQRFYLHILDRAALHCKKVIFFIHPAPVDDLMQFFFQNSIQPDSGASAIALPKRMRHIHLHILLDDLIERRLRHRVDAFQCRTQIHHRCKAEISFCNVHCPHLSSELVDITEQAFMDGRKPFEGACLEGIQQAGVIELKRPGLAEFFFCPSKLSFTRQTKLIL